MSFIPALSRAAFGGLALSLATPLAVMAQGSPAPTVLIDGWATLALSTEDVIVRTESGDRGLDITLTNGQGQLLRVMAAQPSDSQARQVRRFFETVEAVEPGQAGGLPVWQVRGTTDRSPLGRRADAAFEVRMILPQVCLAGGEAVAIAVIADAGNAAAAEALLAGLTLTRPEGAQDCALADLPDLMTGAATEPATPEPPAPQPEPPAVASDEALETVPMMGDLAFLTLIDGATVSGVDDYNGSSEVMVVTGAGELVRFTGAPLQSPLADTVAMLLHRVDGIVSADLGGQPVWLLDGPSRVTVFYGDAPLETATPARVIVPMACTGGQPAYVISVVAEAGHDAGMDPLISAMMLGQPVGATPCAQTIDAMLIPGPTPDTAVGAAVAEASVPGGDHGKLPMPGTMAGQVAEPPPMPEPSFLSQEVALWADAVSQNRPQGFWTYLKAYPQGQFVELARVMLQAGAMMPAQPATPAAPAPATK